VINLHINGQQHQFPASISVTNLLDSLGMAGKRVAVELNGDIVPRSQHEQTLLNDSDRLEIVVAVGGG
jgi:sulfur carrier protein